MVKSCLKASSSRTCILLPVAGHETTTNLIGNVLLTLGKHPPALEASRETPGWEWHDMVVFRGLRQFRGRVG